MKVTGWVWPIARLLEVHDGDTVKLDIDQGFDGHTHKWIRLAAVRAPDSGTPDYTKVDYDLAKADCQDWFAQYAPDGWCSLTTEQSDVPLEIRFRQSFTRYIGRISALGHPELELNAWLRAKGWTDRGE